MLAVVENGPLLLFAALALSAVGDAFLSREGDRAFLGGLASFLAAHLAYIAPVRHDGRRPRHHARRNLARRVAAVIVRLGDWSCSGCCGGG